METPDHPAPKSTGPGGLGPLHTFAGILALLLGGVLIWIIQLARGGDPIGYVILTGLGMLLVLPVVGLVLTMLINAIGRAQQSPAPSRDELRSMYEIQRLLRAQNQELARQLQAAQSRSALPGGAADPPDGVPRLLAPGQVLTPAGFVINGDTFSALDDDLTADLLDEPTEEAG